MERTDRMGTEMHEWFAQPLAAARSEASEHRAELHRLRVAQGRDLGSRLTTMLVTAADRGADRQRRRRATAAAVLRPAS